MGFYFKSLSVANPMEYDLIRNHDAELMKALLLGPINSSLDISIGESEFAH